MQLIDFFDHVYVINLPERKDRLEQMKRELIKMNIPLTSEKVEIFPAIKPESAESFPSIGARGCLLSHYHILKQAKERQCNRVLILEDDLAISKYFEENEARLLEELQQIDWALVYFGHFLDQDKNIKTEPMVSLKPWVKDIQTAHFYGVNGKILERLVNFFEEIQRRPAGHPDGGPMHVDGVLSTFRKQNPDLITIVVTPSMGLQRGSSSDITPKWFDRITPIQKIAKLLSI
ncbi:glycosyltransferase family 25 protein [Planktothrix pseudagardhii]|uniref:Procollagen galactosyltransferase 2 n=1 Tax=Planktothrix pseudagardhii TaxID=132604 RepID=A0A9W4GAE1_9CYAN|nr:glycosyltransferase family 25 protein [Planktothrix pseudagardhii]CAD5976002.1 Procollagen galactosyltransferase 2 [Planktothrix pseudagardhii]